MQPKRKKQEPHITKAHHSPIAQINMVISINDFKYTSAKPEDEDPSKMFVRTAKEALGGSKRDDTVIYGDCSRPPPSSSQ